MNSGVGGSAAGAASSMSASVRPPFKLALNTCALSVAPPVEPLVLSWAGGAAMLWFTVSVGARPSCELWLLPQQKSAEALSVAQAWKSPAVMRVHAVAGLTCWGEAALPPRVPMPSWPKVLSPQQ